MAKNSVSTGSLIFRTIYVTLGVIATLDCTGFFYREYNGDWFVYYTNLSNIICIGVMLLSLIAEARGKGNILPRFRFYVLVMILVTFFVYNFLLADDRTFYTYVTDIDCTLFHFVLPLMYFADWIFFCKRKCLKVFDPLFSTIMPLVYVGFILVRAQLITITSDTLVYPYFFLDLDNLGVAGFLCWIGVLLGVFVALGYLLFAFDRTKLGRK